jgi:hypothetical protein
LIVDAKWHEFGMCHPPHVTSGRRNHLFTYGCQDECMTEMQTSPELKMERDPARILESLVYEFEILSAETQLGSTRDLIDLHGALLVYNLDGRTDLIPVTSISLNRRSMLEFRIARAARRLTKDLRPEVQAFVSVERAAARIEELLHLIDPELCSLAA